MIQFILVLILIFSPLAMGAVRIWAFAPIYILTLAAFLLCVFKQLSSREISFKRTPLDIPILLFFLFSIIAIFNSRYIYASIMEFIRLVSLTLIFYIVVNFITTRQEIKRLLNIILTVGTGMALFGILQYIGIIDKSWWDNPRFLSAAYVNHNHFAGYMEMAIPLSIGMALLQKETSKKSLYIYSFLILALAFVLSMSRGGWLSLSLAVVLMGFMILRKGRPRFIIFILILFFAIAGIFVFKGVDMGFLLRRIYSYRELNFAGRLEIWKGTIGMIRDNLFFGRGIGSFIYNFPRYRPAGLNMLVNYAHNDYLQVASEIGIFALGLMIFIIGKIIKKGMRTHMIAGTSFKTWASLSLATGVLSMAIHSLGDFNLYIPANAILFTVFSGLIFNISSRREKGYPSIVIKLTPMSCRYFRLFTSILVISLIIFISASLGAEICSAMSERAVSSNELEKAEGLGLMALRLCPFNYMYPFKLADIYSKKGEDEKSAAKYKEALRLNPLDSWSWVGLADTYYRLSKNSSIDNDFIKLADSAYTRALGLDPLNSYYLKKIAKFLFNSGNTELSIRMFEKAAYAMSKSKMLSSLSTSFRDGKSYEEIADLAFSAQDIAKAMMFYKMSEGLSDDKEGAKLGQVRCFLKMSFLKDAFGKYRGIKPSPKAESTLFVSLGDYYFRKSQIETAKRFLAKAIAVDPKNPESYYLNHKIAKRINRDAYPAKEIARIVDFNKMPASIDFKSERFEMAFDVKENLYKEGRLKLDVILPEGVYEFKIKAKGQKADEVWPHMKTIFNNKDVMDVYVNDRDLKDYNGIIVVGYPVNRFEIVYDNDYYNRENMEDRNLYIEEIRLKALD